MFLLLSRARDPLQQQFLSTLVRCARKMQNHAPGNFPCSFLRPETSSHQEDLAISHVLDMHRSNMWRNLPYISTTGLYNVSLYAEREVWKSSDEAMVCWRQYAAKSGRVYSLRRRLDTWRLGYQCS